MLWSIMQNWIVDSFKHSYNGIYRQAKNALNFSLKIWSVIGFKGIAKSSIIPNSVNPKT